MAGERHGGGIVVVRRDGDRLGFGSRCNMHELENAAAIGDVRVDDVDGARADDRAKTRTGEQRLSGHDRNGAGAADFRQRFDVLRLARLLEPVRLEFRQRIGEIDGVHRGQAPVHLDEDIDIGPDRIAHSAGDFHRAPDVLLGDIGTPGARERIGELQRGKSAPEHCLRGAGVVLRLLHLVAPAVGVDPHARTAWTAEQIVHRLPGDLSDNVPQRLLDAGGRAIELERAAPLRVVVERDLQDVADMERVSADEIAPEFLDLRGNGAVTVILAVGLTPADHAGIGGQAHEHEILAPAGMDRRHSTVAIFIAASGART